MHTRLVFWFHKYWHFSDRIISLTHLLLAALKICMKSQVSKKSCPWICPSECISNHLGCGYQWTKLEIWFQKFGFLKTSRSRMRNRKLNYVRILLRDRIAILKSRASCLVRRLSGVHLKPQCSNLRAYLFIYFLQLPVWLVWFLLDHFSPHSWLA